jgi:hypothetical protein
VKWLLKHQIMKKIIIAFEFRELHFDAVIRVRKNPGVREFYITVLNWELERLLYGNQVINEVDGVLQANVLEEKKDQTELKLSIACRLSEYLNMRCFAGECLLGTSDGSKWEDFHPIPRHEHELPDGSIG